MCRAPPDWARPPPGASRWGPGQGGARLRVRRAEGLSKWRRSVRSNISISRYAYRWPRDGHGQTCANPNPPGGRRLWIAGPGQCGQISHCRARTSVIQVISASANQNRGRRAFVVLWLSCVWRADCRRELYIRPNCRCGNGWASG